MGIFQSTGAQMMKISIPSLYGNLIAALAAVVVCTVSWIVYLSFFDFREPPIRIMYSHPIIVARDTHDRAGIVDLPVVKVGGMFYTYREYCVTSGYAVLRNERWLIPADSSLPAVPMPLLPARSTQDIKCEQRAYAGRVPDGTKPGEYRFRVMWIYMLDGNPIATFRWNWPDVVIRVVR